METTRTRDPFAGLGPPQRTHHPVQAPYPQYQQQLRPPAETRATPVGRRLLGVAVLVVLTAVTTPVHVLAIFFVFVQVESPGDGDLGSALLLVVGALAASFVALLVTATLAQLAGGFRARWRARTTFAVLSAILAVAVAYGAALTVFP